MALRILLLFLLCSSFLATPAQTSLVQQGQRFERIVKGAQGDLHTVVDALPEAAGGPLLYVEDGLVHKVIRLDQDLRPVDEVLLKDLLHDGLKWNGVAPVIIDGTMHCLLVAAGKKTVEYALVTITKGAPHFVGGFRRLASFEQAPMPDAAISLVRRPLPDPILFTRGLAFVQQERIVHSPDGKHLLLNLPSHGGKDNKRFWFACLDRGLNLLWSGVKELPYADEQSTVQQIALTNDGTIHLVTYVFACKSEEQRADKLCHALHLTTLTGKGDTLNDLLIEKNFVSSARLVARPDGHVSMAIRYGALTGTAGLLMTFDPAHPKLKPTPVVSQRLPSIRKTKLSTFGDPGSADKGSSSSRATAKVPDEVVDLLPAWDGGHLLVEMYLDQQFQLSVGDAIAMRRISGPVRATYFNEKDSMLWEHVAERYFMTTAGQPYETVGISVSTRELLMAYDHTPRGMDGIIRSGELQGDDRGKKIQAPNEPGVFRITRIAPDGTVLFDNTAWVPEGDLLPCPMSLLLNASGERIWVKAFDRVSGYTYSLLTELETEP